MNLKEYAKEMGIENITIESLIESHKRLKEELEDYRSKRKEDVVLIEGTQPPSPPPMRIIADDFHPIRWIKEEWKCIYRHIRR